MRGQFLTEIAAHPVADLCELNRLFSAWTEQIYHRRAHRETGQAPIDRFAAPGVPAVPGPALLREAFLWSETRTVTKTATVSLAGNRYETDPLLAGRKVELIFDPFDLATVEVRYHGQSFGPATPHTVGAHVHPKAASRDDDSDQPPAASGIDYLALVAAEHREATRAAINFADLTNPHPDHRDDHDDHDDQEDPR